MRIGGVVIRWLLPLAVLLTVAGCGIVAQGVSSVSSVAGHADVLRQGRYGRLTETELEWAKIAWRYFEQNTNPETGLVNSIDKYPTTTMWHLADYLAALMAVREFELINSKEFDERISATLVFLNTMKLFFGRLPNR
ncbi:MAG: DUF3131 domain-containing protein, partial [Gammaproteobacteria bacterium]|nr:DUF3131 domain-containing protein [Gammaproteobacteria bacterium]